MQRAAGTVLVQVPADHPPAFPPVEWAKLRAFLTGRYSGDKAADPLLGFSLVFALGSGWMKFSGKTNFCQKCWLRSFSLRDR